MSIKTTKSTKLTQNSRQQTWSQLNQPWDVVVIGGGITGAGIFREAVRAGLKTLLVEQNDFAWGTSSRSSKLVHGGLRYLKQGNISLIQASVQERKRLLAEAPGLITPLGFLIATYKGDWPGRWTYQAGLSIYDMLAWQWSHQYYHAEDFRMLAPRITQKGLEGGFYYTDAQTDDARLVLRVIFEGIADGGTALNYVKAESLIKQDEQVVGVNLCDVSTPHSQQPVTPVTAKIVINATGAWADNLRAELDIAPQIRPLRGSHLIFPAWRLPVAQAITFLHPLDRRPAFIVPWEGVTLVGTTDVDHPDSLDTEPRISSDEVAYLMAAVEAQFPSLNITLDDVIASFAGVRPVIGTGKADPSQESREHIITDENGLLTVTGGKLTTFRLIALDALKHIRHYFSDLAPLDNDSRALNSITIELPLSISLDEVTWQRLLGRYGQAALELVTTAPPKTLTHIPGTKILWAELAWAAKTENVIHLNDLLLRRVRLGLLLTEGGKSLLPQIKALCQPLLGWNDERWQIEETAYLNTWDKHYNLPERASIPNWQAMLAEAEQEQLAPPPSSESKKVSRSVWAGVFLGIALTLSYLFLIQRPHKEVTSVS